MPLTAVRSLAPVRLLEPISGPKDYIAYWRFNEGSGNIAYDSSGNNNNGTIYGATWVNGVIGKALSFDGVDDYVKVPNSASLNISGPITILAWVYVTKLNVDQKICSKQSPGYKLGIYTNNKVEFEIRNPSGTAYLNRDVAGGTVLEANKWYFVGGWWDGSEIRSIVNGNFERPYSYTGSLGTTTNPLTIGGESFTSGFWFNGIIDEVRIYNRALTAEEIANTYRAESLKPARSLSPAR